MAALLILIAVGGAVAVSAYRSRAVADAKIAEDLKKTGPGVGILPARTGTPSCSARSPSS